jgi:hypothetical protein
MQVLYLFVDLICGCGGTAQLAGGGSVSAEDGSAASESGDALLLRLPGFTSVTATGLANLNLIMDSAGN